MHNKTKETGRPKPVFHQLGKPHCYAIRLTCQLNRVHEFPPPVELKIWGVDQNTGKLGLYTLTDAVDTNTGERVLVLWCQEANRVVYRIMPVSVHTPAANDN